MKLCYQVSTPEVRVAPGVTSYQGDLRTSLRALAAVGYDDVELMVRDPRLIDRRALDSALAECGYGAPMICTGEIFGQDRLSFADPNDEVRDEAILRVKAAIDLAGGLGRRTSIGRVRGGYQPGIAPEQTRGRILAALREVVEHAERRSVVVALEPVNTLALNYINSTSQGLELVEQIGSPSFTLMLDTAHMHIEDPDIEESVRASAGRVSWVHLADSNRRYPGSCKFDFPAFLRMLRAVGYDGWLSVEAFSMPDQETALRKSYEYLKPLISGR